MTKKLHMNDFEDRGGCAKVEADGISRDEMTKQMYKLTDGMTPHERSKMYKKFYDREKYHSEKGRWI